MAKHSFTRPGVSSSWTHVNTQSAAETISLQPDHMYRNITAATGATYDLTLGSLLPGDRFIIENGHSSVGDLTVNYIDATGEFIDGTATPGTLVLEPGCIYTFSRESGTGIKITARDHGRDLSWDHLDISTATATIELSADTYYRNAHTAGPATFDLSVGSLTPGDRVIFDNVGTSNNHALTLNYATANFIDGIDVFGSITLDAGCVYTFTRQSGDNLTITSTYCGPQDLAEDTNDIFKQLDQYALASGATPVVQIDQDGYTAARLEDATGGFSSYVLDAMLPTTLPQCVKMKFVRKQVSQGLILRLANSPGVVSDLRMDASDGTFTFFGTGTQVTVRSVYVTDSTICFVAEFAPAPGSLSWSIFPAATAGGAADQGFLDVIELDLNYPCAEDSQTETWQEKRCDLVPRNIAAGDFTLDATEGSVGFSGGGFVFGGGGAFSGGLVSIVESVQGQSSFSYRSSIIGNTGIGSATRLVITDVTSGNTLVDERNAVHAAIGTQTFVSDFFAEGDVEIRLIDVSVGGISSRDITANTFVLSTNVFYVTNYSKSGGVVTSEDFETDNVTPYTPSGVTRVCDHEPSSPARVSTDICQKLIIGTDGLPLLKTTASIPGELTGGQTINTGAAGVSAFQLGSIEVLEPSEYTFVHTGLNVIGTAGFGISTIQLALNDAQGVANADIFNTFNLDQRITTAEPSRTYSVQLTPGTYYIGVFSGGSSITDSHTISYTYEACIGWNFEDDRETGAVFGGSGSKVATFLGNVDIDGILDPDSVVYDDKGRFSDVASAQAYIEDNGNDFAKTTWVNPADGMLYLGAKPVGSGGADLAQVITDTTANTDNLAILFPEQATQNTAIAANLAATVANASATALNTSNVTEIGNIVGSHDAQLSTNASNIAANAAAIASLGSSLVSFNWEENGGLANGSNQWSIGNGSTGNTGVVIPKDGRIKYMTFQSETAGTSVTIEILENNSNVIGTGSFTGQTGVFEFATPIEVGAGADIRLRTGTEVGAYSDARVSMFVVLDDVL